MKPVDDQLYQVFLLRLWRTHTGAPWRASLESTESSAQHHFASIDDLAHFLQTKAHQSTDDEA